jgi:hypothetical protein
METSVSDLLSQLAFVPRQNIDEIIDLSCDILTAIAHRQEKPPRPVVFELRECFNALSTVLPEDETIVQIKAMFVAFVICPIIAAPWDHDATGIDASFKMDPAVKSTLSFASDAAKSISDGSILISDSIKLRGDLVTKVTAARADFRDWMKKVATPTQKVVGGELAPVESDASVDFSMVVHSPQDTTVQDLKNGSGSSSDIASSIDDTHRSTGALRLTDSGQLSQRDQQLLAMLSLAGESSESLVEPPNGAALARTKIVRAQSDATESAQASSMQVEYDSDEKILLSSSSGVNYRRRSQIRHLPLLLPVDESPDSYSLTLNTDSTEKTGKVHKLTRHKPSSQDLSEFPSRSEKPEPPRRNLNRSRSKVIQKDLGHGSSSNATTTSSIDRKAALLSTPSGSSADLTDMIISRRVVAPVSKRRLVRSKSEEKFDYNSKDDLGFEDSSDAEIPKTPKLVFLSPRTKLGSQGSLSNLTPRISSTLSDEFKPDIMSSEALSVDLWETPAKKVTVGDLIPAARFTVILALRSFGCVMCRRTVSHFVSWIKVMQAIHAQYVLTQIPNGSPALSHVPML